MREEELDRQFRAALAAIAVDEKALAWMVTALKESHADEKQHHDESVARLQKQYQQLQNRLDAMYVDKLEVFCGARSNQSYRPKSPRTRTRTSVTLIPE